MSRIGKKPIAIPKGVTVKVAEGAVEVQGPKGKMRQIFPQGINFELADGHLTAKPASDDPELGKYHGLARSLVANAVFGVTDGYKRELDIVGVGYRAEVKGQALNLALGLSHPVNYTLPKSVSARVETIDEGGIKRPRLHLASYDKEALGQTAARIRSFRPPEPYKGKGVRYTGEKLREKAGKAGGKK